MLEESPMPAHQYMNPSLYEQLKFLSDGNAPLPEWARLQGYLVNAAITIEKDPEFKVWLTSKTLASLLGHTRPSPGKFLDRLRKAGWILITTPEIESVPDSTSKPARKSTRLYHIDHPNLEAWKKLSVQPVYRADLINLETGKPFGRIKPWALEESASRIERVEELRQSLNRSSKMHDRGPKVAFQMSHEILSGNLFTGKTDAQRTCALRSLQAIVVNPQPQYSAKNRSPRLYSAGDGVLSLPRELRKEYCKRMGWVCLDLKSAQLAIVAKLWKIDSILNLLKTGQSVWEYLESITDAPKLALKDAVYAVIFGASVQRGVKLAFLKHECPDEMYKAFLQVDIVSDLLNARDDELKKIEDMLYGVDCFGRRIECDSIVGVEVQDKRSVLAQVVQSFEMKLMLDIADDIAQTSASITLWVHDGIALRIRNGKGEAFRQDAKERMYLEGYFTELVME